MSRPSKPSSERSPNKRKNLKKLVKKLTPPPRKLRKSSPLSLRRRKLNLKRGNLPSLPRLRLLPLRQLNWRLPSRRPPRKSPISEKKLTRRLLSLTLVTEREELKTSLKVVAVSEKSKIQERIDKITTDITTIKKEVEEFTTTREEIVTEETSARTELTYTTQTLK